MNIILLGAPGSGKGTQAKRLSALFGLRHLSTGDLIRAEISEATPLGLEIQEIVERGDLPSDSVAISLIEKDLSQNGQGVIFDGFPRTLSQAEALNKLVDMGTLDRPLVVKIEVEETLLVERLAGRWMCGDCGAIYSTTHLPQQKGRCDVCGSHSFVTRKDDEVTAIHHRLKVYHEKTEPVQGYYEAQGCLMTVNGVLSPLEVEGQLVELLKQEEKKASLSQTS